MKDIFMVKISGMYNKFDAAPDFRDLTKTSHLQDRKVDNVAFLSTVKNKDFSKFKIDAQGNLYKRGSIKQVFRDIANVFTSSSTLKERNFQVASKIVELRSDLLKNGASKVNVVSYAKSLGARMDALQAKVKSMSLGKEEKLLFSSFLEHAASESPKISKDTSLSRVLERVETLKNIDTTLQKMEKKFATGDDNAIMQHSLDLGAKMVVNDLGNKKIVDSLQKVMEKIGQNITKSSEGASDIEKLFIKKSISELTASVKDALDTKSAYWATHYVKAYSKFAEDMLQERTTVFDTNYCNQKFVAIGDKYMDTKLAGMSQEVHMALEGKLLDAFKDAAQVQAFAGKEVSVGDIMDGVAENVYKTHFAAKSEAEILNPPVLTQDSLELMNIIQQSVATLHEGVKQLPTCNAAEQQGQIAALKEGVQNISSHILNLSDGLSGTSLASKKLLQACVKNFSENIESKLESKDFAGIAKLPEDYTNFLSEYFANPNAVALTKYVKGSIENHCNTFAKENYIEPNYEHSYKDAMGELLTGHFRSGTHDESSLDAIMTSFSKGWYEKYDNNIMSLRSHGSSPYLNDTSYTHLEDALFIDAVYLHGVKDKNALKMCLSKIPEMRDIQPLGNIEHKTLWKAVLNEEMPEAQDTQAPFGQSVYERTDLHNLSYTEQGKVVHKAWLQDNLSTESAVALAREQRPITLKDFTRPPSFTQRAMSSSMQGVINTLKTDIANITDGIEGQSPTYTFRHSHGLVSDVKLPPLQEREEKLEQLARDLDGNIEKMCSIYHKQSEVLHSMIREGGKIVSNFSELTGLKVDANTPIDINVSKVGDAYNSLKVTYTVLPTLNTSATKQFEGSFSYIIEKEGASHMSELNLATTDYQKN